MIKGIDEEHFIIDFQRQPYKLFMAFVLIVLKSAIN